MNRIEYAEVQSEVSLTLMADKMSFYKNFYQMS